MSDIDTRLKDQARRWRAAQSAPPPFDPSQLERLRSGSTGDRRRVVLIAAAAVAAACVVVAGVLAALPRRNSVTVSISSTSGDTSVLQRPGVPIAVPPLLAHVPDTTKPVLVATGGTGQTGWKFYVQFSAFSSDRPSGPTRLNGKPPTQLGPGLCLLTRSELGQGAGQGASGRSCDDPAKMASLTWHASGEGSSTPKLVYGVTSAPAARVVVGFVDGASRVSVAVSVAAVSKREFPGLRFFVVQPPPGLEPPGSAFEVVALAANGTPLMRSDPTLPSPPWVPSAVPHPAMQDAYPLWPLDPSNTANRDSAEAVTRDFSTSALGVTGNAVTPDAKAAPNGPTAVSIELPASHRSLRVLASPNPDGRWTLIQVGDQAQQRGITFGPRGPTMAIQPLHDAIQADITELADGTIQHVHLTHGDLQTGNARLAGHSIHNVLIIYRNSAGVALDATGGEFG